MVIMKMLDFWKGKRVLITGHSGFKGSWLSLWLHMIGAEVIGISLSPNTSPNLFELTGVKSLIQSHFIDIRNYSELLEQVKIVQPEVVFHLAAQPLVRASYLEPLATIQTNVIGTANLLEALRFLDSVKVVVMVTSDKVYKNNEWIYPYRECDVLGGHDPYSASKAASEILIASYRDAFLKEQGVAVASARAGNVIGGGDWSEDRLIPDAVRAWESNLSLDIRNPNAIRPWQHVLEPLQGYLTLAERLWHEPDLAGAYNFGPDKNESASVLEVIELARKAYANSIVSYGANSDSVKEAGWLAIETAKSKFVLDIKTKWNLSETISRTMNWYKAHYSGQDARKLCIDEIIQYENWVEDKK